MKIRYKICRTCTHPKSDHVFLKGFPVLNCWRKQCRCRAYEERVTTVKPAGKHDAERAKQEAFASISS